MPDRETPPVTLADHVVTLRQQFDAWAVATEFTRNCKNPVDAGDQMAQRDAHELLVEFDGVIRAIEAGATLRAAPAAVQGQCNCPYRGEESPHDHDVTCAWVQWLCAHGLYQVQADADDRSAPAAPVTPPEDQTR